VRAEFYAAVIESSREMDEGERIMVWLSGLACYSLKCREREREMRFIGSCRFLRLIQLFSSSAFTLTIK
jgi:hypothetical protein